MKTNVKVLLAIALMATACTTGSKVTSSTNTDDLYFTPGDAQPVAPKPEKEVKQPQKKSTVVMQVEENEQGKVVNNYVVPKSSRKDNNAYYFDDQPAYSDTTLEYKDNKEQVTVNNYYEGEEMDYSTRIRAFYNPYFYNPFWDPFWDPFYGFGYGYYGYGFGPSWGFGGFYPDSEDGMIRFMPASVMVSDGADTIHIMDGAVITPVGAGVVVPISVTEAEAGAVEIVTPACKITLANVVNQMRSDME